MARAHRDFRQFDDAILLFRVGDFYETFFQDAITLASVLSITLTARGHAGGAPISLAGFPVKALDGYLPKLVAAGLRVVICDQVEDANESVTALAAEVAAAQAALDEATRVFDGAPDEVVAREVLRRWHDLAEREAVSAAALAAPSDAARRLDGADWGDPAAQPPDRPR